MVESVSNQKSVAIKISGMSCNHCVQHVEKALLQTRGVSTAKVDLSAEKAFVDYDQSEINEETLLQVVENAGYKGIITRQ